MQPFTSPHKDPFIQFAKWFEVAKADRTISDATAMVVSTLGENGFPDSRWVLLKSFDERGFVFYTNLQSVKGRELAKSAKAALAILWDSGKGRQRQVRIQGKTEIVSDGEADAYWVTRPRLAQLGAWTSMQSEPLGSRFQFMKELARVAARYKLGPVPRPPHWTGVRVVPHAIEFWQGRPNRLHDRFLYIQKGADWTIQRLYP